MTSRVRGGALLFTAAAWLGIFAACSDEPRLKPSGGALTPSARTPSIEISEEGAPPIIHSVEFKPPHILPGRSIRAHVKAVDPEGRHIRLGFRWSLNGRPLEAAGADLDVPTWARRGDRIGVEVIADNGESDSQPFTLASRVANRRPGMTDIRIRTEERGGAGRWVAEPEAEDPDGDRLSFRYLWILNGQDSENRTAILERERAKRGDEIRLEVWASDGDSESLPLKSAPFRVGNSPPEIVSRPPAMDGSGLFLYVVQATDPDGDADLVYSLEKGPRGMSIDPSSGELQWQATLADAGEHEIRIAVDDRQGGLGHQGFFVQVEMILPPPGPGQR